MTPERKIQRDQRARIRFVLMGLVSYAMAMVVITTGAVLGVLAWRYVGHLLIAVVAINLGLYGLFRSGLNLRFAAPNFTAVQIVLPLLPLLYVTYHVETPMARAAILLIALIGLLYGVLDLPVRRFVTVTALYFTGYLALFALLSVDQPAVLASPGEWMLLLAIGLFMLQMGVIGGYINQLRHRLIARNHQIAEMASHDELTGVYNRRYLIDALTDAGARAERGGLYGVCLIDLDHFKRINDERGHNAGDNVLQRCAVAIGA